MANAATVNSLAPKEMASSEPPVAPKPVGEWIETLRYRVRVLEIVPCDPKPGSAAATGSSTAASAALAAPSAPASAPPADELVTVPDSPRSRFFRLGVNIEVEATEHATLSGVMASARGGTLEKEGKVFQASVDPRATGNCKELIEAKKLAPGESTKGMLVFEAPDEAYFRGSLFAFRPPRWGGDVRAEALLPDCFDEGCGGVKPIPVKETPK